MPCTSCRGRPRVRAALVPALVLLLPALAAADPLSFTETFATTAYRDAAATTAWWDTGTGRLTLGATEPVLLGAIDTPGTARVVRADGAFAYVADRTGGLRVYGTGDPAAPVFLGAYDPATSVDCIAVDGDRALSFESSSGNYYLRVISLADPAAPVLVGAMPTWYYAGEDAVIDGRLCLVAAGTAGLRLLDVSWNNPVELGSYNTSGYAYGVAASGRHAVVADNTAILVFDISDPAAPALVGSCPAASAGDVAVSGRYAYVTADPGLVVVDLADPAAPQVVASLEAAGAWDVSVDGDWAYVAAGRDGFYVFDVHDPVSPFLVYAADTPGGAFGVEVQGDLLHVADGAGLRIYRIAEPVTPPERVGRFSIGIGASAVAVQGDQALVTTYGTAGDLHSHLFVLDVSDPAAPVEQGRYWVGNTYEEQMVDVAAYGDRALVVWDWWSASYPDSRTGRVTTIDISDPAIPVETCTAGWPEELLRCTVRGGRLFAVGHARSTAAGLWVLDVADPDAMTPVSATLTPDRWATDIAIVGHHAFVVEPWADDNENLQVYDIADPAAPVLAWHGYMTYGYGTSQWVPIGNHALEIGGVSATVFDITDPAAPAYATTFYSSSGDARRAALSGRYMVTGYFYTGGGTLGLIDLGTPTAPIQLAQSFPARFITDVAASGDHAYVTTYGTTAGTDRGLDIYRIFERGCDASANVAQSLTLDTSPLPVYGARIGTVQSGTILWQLSPDGGTTWEDVVPGADWHRFGVLGSDLRWRATLQSEPGEEPPSCSELVVEWYHTDAADAGDAGLPARFALAGAGPNPFNARTTVAYDVPAGGGPVRIAVYDLRGRRLRSLVDGVRPAGRHDVAWDGRDGQGRTLPGGTYVCLMQAPGCRQAAKLSFVP